MISSIEQIWRYTTINGVPATFCEIETNRDSNSLMRNTDDPYSCNGKPSGSLSKETQTFFAEIPTNTEREWSSRDQLVLFTVSRISCIYVIPDRCLFNLFLKNSSVKFLMCTQTLYSSASLSFTVKK